MNICERAEAKSKGLKFYFTGRPCKHGHLCERYTADGVCYECHALKMKRRYEQNQDAIKAKSRVRYAENGDVIKGRVKAYREKNPEKAKEVSRRWYEKNKTRVRAVGNAYVKQRAQIDPVFAAQLRGRKLINNCLRAMGFKKASSTEEILGCDWEFFKSHIERQFLPGMSWGNRTEWHIDHITPISTAKTVDEVLALNHVSNLRPLWAKDNLEKGSKVEFLI